MDESENILKEQFRKLPIELQDFIGGSLWISESEKIAKKHSFTEEETESLRLTVLFVLTGLIATEDMSESLVSDLGIQKRIALDIQNEVADAILSKLPPMSFDTLLSEDVLLSPAENLIEDQKGNADNNVPNLPGEKEVMKPTTPLNQSVTPEVTAQKVALQTQASSSPQSSAPTPTPPVTNTPAQKVGTPITDAEWEARKKALEAGELVMKTAYGSKPDPYREPTA